MVWTKTQKRDFKKFKKSREPKLPAPFKWDPAKERCAVMIATEDLGDEELAKRSGVSRRSIVAWRQRSEFKARVEEHFQEWKKRVRDKGLALKERRLLSYLEDYENIQKLRRDRIAMYGPHLAPDGLTMIPGIPGWETGFSVLVKKTIAGREVDHYEYDNVTLGRSLEVRKQLAIELGEWENKLEVTGADGGAIDMQITGPDGNPLRELGPETLMEILLLMKTRSAQAQPTIDVTPKKLITE